MPNEIPPRSTLQFLFKSLKQNLVEKSITSLLTAVVSVIAAIISTLPIFKEVNNPALANDIPFYVTIGLGVFTVTTFIIFFVSIIRRRTAQSSQLRKQVSEAFIAALDKSSFNPSQKVKQLDVQSTN